MPRTKHRRIKNKKKKRALTRYIFVCGGVLSGVGKGTAVASLGRLLISKGYSVAAMKIDPYLNVDAGTMNPVEHGEVYVTGDGLESDQDLGNYERFLGQPTSRANYMTTGQVYLSVISRERNLEYGGKCVETVPHIPEEVIRRITHLGKKSRGDFVLVEIGGTVGEYQNLVYLEAARLMKLQHPGTVQFIMVSYMPVPATLGEMKTKPTQYAVHTLNTAGIQPDFLICRGMEILDNRRKEKLSLFCNMPPTSVISAPDVGSIYDVPICLDREHLAEKVLTNFGLQPKRKDLKEWKRYTASIHRMKKIVRIALVGKYFVSGHFLFSDSYVSVIEALRHASWAAGYKPELTWVDAERYESDPHALHELDAFDGIVVPGGFGTRGVEGIIAAIGYTRKKNIPFFGLCYGMQLAVIEFCRNVVHLRGAHTTEVQPTTPYPVIDVMTAQKEKLKLHQYGGTMRLGDYRCVLRPGTRTASAYRARSIVERHRHRYELNTAYKTRLEKAGMIVAGTNPETQLAEAVELRDHPFFIGVQYHPEFLSQPMKPHPLFSSFVHSCSVHQRTHTS